MITKTHKAEEKVLIILNELFKDIPLLFQTIYGCVYTVLHMTKSQSTVYFTLWARDC